MLGVDTGGTFTDFVFIKNGRIKIAKRPSTPDNPAQAIVAGVLQADHAGEAVNQVIHGTTVATNAILERKGAKTALITNRGLNTCSLSGDKSDLICMIHPRLAEPLIPLTFVLVFLFEEM